MTTAIFSPETLAQTVEHLAAIRATIADLQQEEKEARALLVAAGLPEIDGITHRVTISTTYKVSIDWRAIAERLSPSTQLITAHTHKAEEPTYTLRLSGRKVTK